MICTFFLTDSLESLYCCYRERGMKPEQMLQTGLVMGETSLEVGKSIYLVTTVCDIPSLFSHLILNSHLNRGHYCPSNGETVSDRFSFLWLKSHRTRVFFYFQVCWFWSHFDLSQWCGTGLQDGSLASRPSVVTSSTEEDRPF